MLREKPVDDVWFSRRQRQVLSLVDEGRSTKEIADRLGISDLTAQWHISFLMRRLGVRGRCQLLVWVRRHPEAIEHGRVFTRPFDFPEAA